MKKFMNLLRRESANTIYLVDYLHPISYNLIVISFQ